MYLSVLLRLVIVTIFLFLIAIIFTKNKDKITKSIGEEDYEKIKKSYLYHYTGVDEANQIMVSENKALFLASYSSKTSKILNFNEKGIHFFINEPSLLNKIYNITPNKHQKRIKINGAKLRKENIIKKSFFNTIIYTCDYCDEAILEDGDVDNLYFQLHERFPTIMGIAIILVTFFTIGFIIFIVYFLLFK